MSLPALDPGTMRDRIELRRFTKTPDGQGAFEETWSTYAKPYAEVEGISGREAVIGEAFQGVSFFRVRIYHRADVGQADQVLYRGQELNITSATDPNGDREQLLILADTGSAKKTT